MRCVEIEFLPADGDYDRVRLVFERDGHRVQKIRLLQPSADESRNEFALMLAAREADRDLAYAAYGDAWADHVELAWWSPGT